MKRLSLIMLAVCVALTTRAQFHKATLQATGLTCAMCSNAINKALQEVPFISKVKSDIKNSAFNIDFKEGQDVDIDALKEAVEDAGFSIGSLKLTGNFKDIAVKKDEHMKIGNMNFHFLDVKPLVLTGEQTILVVDKNFITAKKFKLISASSKMECVKEGKAKSCCEKEGMEKGERVYHVTI